MNGAFDVPVIADIAFWVISALVIGAALLVVTLRDVFKAAIFLALTFLGVAALFFLLQAEFIAIVQILVYVGAVSIIIAFAVMLIRNIPEANQPTRLRAGAAAVSALFLAAVAFVGYSSDWTHIDTINDQNAQAALVGSFTEQPMAGTDDTEVAAADPGADGAQSGVLIDSTGEVGALLIRDYVLPFETVGLVLIAALIGGLVLMRERRAG